jgi:4-azaleucine resistance transporter AzlC
MIHGPIVFTLAGLRRGAVVSLPLLIGLVPFGVVCGITQQAAGLSLGETILMAGLVYAGASQLVALAAWTHPASVLTATLAALVVNLRLALMGPVLAPWLDRLRGWRVWLSLFTMVDPSWALSVREISAGYRDAGFLLGAGTTMWLSWMVTSIAGHLLGAAIQPPPGHPIFFAALAVFVALLVNLWRGRADVLPWLAAGAVAVVTARLLPGTSWYMLTGALAGSLLGALRDARAKNWARAKDRSE